MVDESMRNKLEIQQQTNRSTELYYLHGGQISIKNVVTTNRVETEEIVQRIKKCNGASSSFSVLFIDKSFITSISADSGVGFMLYREGLKFVKQIGFVHSMIKVWETRPKSLHWYKRLGFRETGQVDVGTSYPPGCPETRNIGRIAIDMNLV
ncbi:hypothetical protein BDA99DRAFT_536383 [Phascolomyces articulosus]|uniref:Uncharacterized protein n=1 Tax=Phascolomyces articulosus TaxID=60185 RepID=A0AAD5K1H9_9FUNG|nr:hypothetical protein BDA99DRAFT_536383 [Phascolomyces articulosus]